LASSGAVSDFVLKMIGNFFALITRRQLIRSRRGAPSGAGGHRAGQGGTIPRAPKHWGGVEKSTRCRKCFLQNSTFAQEEP